MGIYGVGDNVVHPNQADLIEKSVPVSRIKMMAGSKHFPMLDEPQAFNEYLGEFLAFEFATAN
jgi:pimeloyl-ACP methyl ester carboxylesterase